MRNAISKSHFDKQLWIGNDINLIQNTTKLIMKSPFERGILTCWDVQREIWDILFNEYNVEEYRLQLRLLMLLGDSWNNWISVD